MAVNVVSWNLNQQPEPWRELAKMAADPKVKADVALLQEAMPPPNDVADKVDLGPNVHWDSHVWNHSYVWNSIEQGGRSPEIYDRWAMVVKLSDRVDVDWFKQVSPISYVAEDEIAVSGIGTIAAARVTPNIPARAEPFIVVSMYARWIRPHPSTGSKWTVGYSDGSAHRIISDLSAFIGHTAPSKHRILAAGDLNMIYRALEGCHLALPARDATVWPRMEALGLEFLGPQHPNGRQAAPPSICVPDDSKNVPTYFTRGRKPETAQNQLDYVFASRGFHEGISVRALNYPEKNHPDTWGYTDEGRPLSDHCRLCVTVRG